MTGQDLDLQIMKRLQAGERTALEMLYDRHSPLMYGTALKILRSTPDAEDSLQEAWIQVWNNARQFDPNRGSVASWLVTIARSRALDRYRSLSSRRRAQSALDTQPTDPPPDPRDWIGRIGLQEKINGALLGLDPKHRQVLEMAYYEGFSQSEIAERLLEPLGTVKYWTRQGLLRLRETMAESVRKEEWA
jgi:RNA polymerase sigma-70 factor (ECF subfamily)